MTDYLFNPPEQDSPRLAWMKKHEVSTTHVKADPIAYDEMWIASSPYQGRMRAAPTEDEAIVSLAKANGWRLWNEVEIDYDDLRHG